MKDAISCNTNSNPAVSLRQAKESATNEFARTYGWTDAGWSAHSAAIDRGATIEEARWAAEKVERELYGQSTMINGKEG